MNIKEQLQEVYGLLPDSAKEIAWNIYGVSGDYFRKIVAGNVKDESVYPIALQAVRQAAKQYGEQIQKDINQIDVISETIKNL